MSVSKQLPSGIEVRIRQDLSEGSRGATTLTVDPIITKAGYRVTMADIGERGFGKIDQNNPREEIISWTGMTDNGTTYTLTGIVWGVNFHDRTGNVSANMKRHISGANFSINTDMHYIADQFDLYVKKEDFNVSDNSIGWGDGTKDHNKVLEARNGSVNVPYIEYDETLNKWLISNDGVNSFDPEDGGSGVTAGDAISIIAGEVNVKTKEASGIHITEDEVAIEYQTNPGLAIEDNKLGVKIKENTGLVKDADGLWCDSIDPDNPVAQSPAQLIGGTDVVLQNFINLGVGDNNGKFTANIDGVEYEDLALDLVNGFIPSAIEQLNFDNYSSTSNAGQSFKNVSLKVIKSILIKMQTWNSGSTCILSLYEGEGIAGTPIATASASVGNDVTFTFSSAVILKENQQYTFNINRASGVFSPRWYSAGGYSDGNAYLSLTKETTVDLYFRIINDTFTLANDGINYILFLLNEKIKTETGKAHTAVYNTDHFEITNAVAGFYKSILRFTAPTTGTDISGAGYLDLGANATEIAGDGDDYKLVRLDSNGKLPDGLNNIGENQIVSGRELNTVYQNTSARTKIVLVSTLNSGYNNSNTSDTLAYIGTTNTPSTLVGHYSTTTAGNNRGQLFMIVPPDYYYTITATKGGSATLPTLVSWFECDLI